MKTSKLIKQVLFLTYVASLLFIFTSFIKNNELPSHGKMTQQTITKDGMVYLLLSQPYSNDGGVVVINLTLDKAKLNYYNELCK